ncbi:hypothetical protein KAU11_00715, partial [Candidatus Babeliales bacterium]|nr:hypothetical protein [Candidatus Babeliales bacterium]
MKQTFKFISLLLLLIIQQGGQAKVILVHGTYSTTKDWFLPEGGFCKKLLEKNPTKNEQVIYIKWDGAPNSLSRLEGSEKLAHIILKLHTQSTIKTGKETLSLIGHSHGGSVINLACNLLEFARSEITENTMQELCEELLILSLIEYDLASVARAISEKYKSSLNLLTKKLKLKKGFIKNHTDLINALVSQVVLHKPHQETVDTYKIKIKSIIESLQKQAVGK